jgi:hypothetical protein
MNAPTYDIKWLASATFADLDAAMKDVTIRRILEPVLRSPEGEALGKRIIENRGKETQPTGVYNLAWMKSIRPLPNALALLKTALLDPNAKAQLNQVMRTVEGATLASKIINNLPLDENEVAPEELAAIQADQQRADEAAAADAAAAEAAANGTVAETPVVTAPVVEAPKKVVVDYQVTDEQTGAPIGRPTHIEGKSAEEVIEKLKNAHINAVRYAERLKKNQAKSAESSTESKRARQQAEQLEQEANLAVETAVKENNPAKLKDAISKVSRAEREAEVLRQAAVASELAIAQAWVDDNPDFYVCDASSSIMRKWLDDNGLKISYENLSRAFAATKSKLPIAELETSVAPESNPPAAASAAAAAPAASITQPAAAATETASTATSATPQSQSTASETTPAAAQNAQPAARRPGVNAGLEPGAMSAQRPAVQQKAKTTQESISEFRKLVGKMPHAEFRKRMASSKEFRDQAAAAGIRDAASRQ